VPPERCGAHFRKSVHKISDRAKRYRAHSPGCRPAGPKRCAIFGCKTPTQNVVPDHIDGDESNGRRSNLRWLCKSHNTMLGKKMAKAGKGVRTRQYNPGAINLAQYVQAAMDHVRGSHDAGGKVLHETPVAIRRQFAKEIWWRRGYRGNPPRDIMPEFWKGKLRDSHGKIVTDSAQAKAILLSELRALGRIPKRNPERPESEKLSHAAVRFESPSRHPGQACASCVHLIAASPLRCESVKPPIKKMDWCKRYQKLANGTKRNSPADDLYKAFHGRGPDKITTMLVSGVDPYGEHRELTSLGPLIRLVVGEDVELSEQGEVTAADWVNEITFVPSMAEYRKITERLDPKDGQQLREFKAWVKRAGAPDVAAVPNTKQLYFVGGNQFLDDKRLVALGADPEKDLCDLGYAYLIEYFAQKRFDKFEPTTYFHAFGEKSGVQPRLVYMRVPKLLLLVGGEYVVRSVGIDN
jgi:hypothetical protein